MHLFVQFPECSLSKSELPILKRFHYRLIANDDDLLGGDLVVRKLSLNLSLAGS